MQHAQVWADNIAATGVVQHDPNLGLEGENIAVFQRNEVADCTHAVQGWYNEERLYDYDNPGFHPDVGHFTQIVWKATTAVGVSQRSTGSGSSKLTYIVARYLPAGNVRGQFQQNVGRKTVQ